MSKSRLPAIREIKKLQCEYKPVIPLAPFAKVVRWLLFQHGPYRLTREALESLRCATEQYALDTLQSANFLTMHHDRATLLPKDIRMARRIKGEDNSFGMTEEAQTQWKADWNAFSEKRVTAKQALWMEAARRRKLSAMVERRIQRQRKAMLHQ